MTNIWSVQRVIEEIDKEEIILYVGNGVTMEEVADKRIVLFNLQRDRQHLRSQ